MPHERNHPKCLRTPKPTAKVQTIVAALACTLALVACGNDRGAAPATSGAPPPTASTPTVSPSTSAPVPGKLSCAVTTSGWSTNARSSPSMSRDALYLVRTGRHDCFDRVVFDLNGMAEAGFAVSYVPVVTSDPKGDPLPVPGGAALEVVVRAPALGTDDSGRMLANTGDELVTTPGWPALRAVRFAGSFEGVSTFAVGVRATLPFRVFTQVGSQDRIRHVVLDIGH